MSISHGGYAFESITTHQLPIEGDWEQEPKVVNFYGVPGSVEIRDAIHGREITLEAKFSGYSTRALLQAALTTLDSKINSLNDKTLTITTSGDTLTYYHCTFRGFRRVGQPMQVDGSSVNDWFQDGALVWWQLKRTA